MTILFSSLLELLSPQEIIGKYPEEITRIVPLHSTEHSPTTLTWCSDSRIQELSLLRFGTVLCSPQAKTINPPAGVCLLIVDLPRTAFYHASLLFVPPPQPPSIAASAQIDPSATIDPSVTVGENVVIGAGTHIGKQVTIGANTVIFRNTIIGNFVTIGANTTIGNQGFGFEVINGVPHRIPHLGNVVIQDYVEIGNNNTIDRGTLESTLIEHHVKTDNGVHIAHNVKVGHHTFLTAHVMIAGSTTIGSNTWIAPSAAITDRVTLSPDITIGIGAVIVEKPGSHIGEPGDKFLAVRARCLGASK